MGAGDTRALGELYDRYATLLHSIAATILKDAPAEESAEVVREIWRQVWTRASIYDPSYGPVALWLVLLTRDRAVERSRELPPRTEAERLVTGAMQRQDKPMPAGTQDIQSADRSRNMLARLSAEQRDALTAALFEKLTIERLAARHQVPEAEAKQWVREGLGRIAELLPVETPV
jgi:RNA polymerase sigma-70 factor (ECF subfamily)